MIFCCLEMAPVLHKCHLICSEMMHFVQQVQYYINFEVYMAFRPLCLSVCLLVCLSACMSVCMFVPVCLDCICVSLSFWLPVSLSIYISAFLDFIYLYVDMFVFVFLPVYYYPSVYVYSSSLWILCCLWSLFSSHQRLGFKIVEN